MSRGVIYIHAAPAALCPHVEWAIQAALGQASRVHWTPQPVQPGSYRAELTWEGPTGTASKLASGLRHWKLLRFEVTENPSATSEGCRYSFTPSLGMFAATIDAHGDLLIPENRLLAARQAAADGHTSLNAALDSLLGTAWDEELETYRSATDVVALPALYQVS